MPGGNAEIADMKNAFERGNDPLVGGAAGHDPNAIAGTLKLYLRSLANPVRCSMLHAGKAPRGEAPQDRSASFLILTYAQC